MEYFTKKEIADVRAAFKSMSGAGIVIAQHSGGDQMGTFFDRAKLWRAIDHIISVLYIDKLAAGELPLYDKERNEYQVVKK